MSQLEKASALAREWEREARRQRQRADRAEKDFAAIYGPAVLLYHGKIDQEEFIRRVDEWARNRNED